MKRSFKPRPGSVLMALLLTSTAWGLFGDDSPALWQERYFFDALLTARSKIRRSQSDPNLLPVMNAIASQAAQQVANLRQIGSYVATQKENLQYAFDQPDPEESLKTIELNLDTLAQGAEQVKNNLYYLTARCRMASSQALPDAEFYQASLLIIGQIQQLQLVLNSLYIDTVEVRDRVTANKWAADKHFNHKIRYLYRSVVNIQDSIFTVYNSAYELSLRSR